MSEPAYISYSMFEEDLLLAERLGRDGFLIDVGASDGIHFSNSRLLLTALGWSGILFEPNPVAFQQLVKNSSELKAWCLPFAVGNADKDHTTFHVDISTPDYSSLVRVDPERQYVPVDVRMISVSHLLRGLPTVNLLLIDTEGYDTAILREVLRTGVLRGEALPHCIVVEAQTEVELDIQIGLLQPKYGEMVKRFAVEGDSRTPCNTMWMR